MEEMKLYQAPVFTSWHCRHSFAPQSSFVENDLFKVPADTPAKLARLNGSHRLRKVRSRNGAGMERQCSREPMQKKPGRRRAPKAVDEDLYKIPKELLCQKPKGKRKLRTLISGCLSLQCIP